MGAQKTPGNAETLDAQTPGAAEPSDPIAEVDVVIVAYEPGPDLEACLSAFAEEPAAPAQRLHLLVVDNASPSGTARALAESRRRPLPQRAAGDPANGMPEFSLLELPRNIGFGAAANRGAEHGNAPWILVLNPDCRIDPASLARLVKSAEHDDRIAAIGPNLVDERGVPEPSGEQDPTLFREFKRRSLYRRLQRADPETRRQLADRQSVSRSVDWLTGACLLFRRAAFMQLGGFDESFFLYYEDADLCRRLRHDGWQIRYEAGARAVHRGGTSTGELGLRLRFVVRSSQRRYFEKHNSRLQRALLAAHHAITK